MPKKSLIDYIKALEQKGYDAAAIRNFLLKYGYSNEEISEPLTSRIITQKIETRAIETFGSTQTRILVPEETRTGDYILRAVVEYDDKKAVATLPIKIVRIKKAQTCFDGIKNLDEQ